MLRRREPALVEGREDRVGSGRLVDVARRRVGRGRRASARRSRTSRSGGPCIPSTSCRACGGTGRPCRTGTRPRIAFLGSAPPELTETDAVGVALVVPAPDPPERVDGPGAGRAPAGRRRPPPRREARTRAVPTATACRTRPAFDCGRSESSTRPSVAVGPLGPSEPPEPRQAPPRPTRSARTGPSRPRARAGSARGPRRRGARRHRRHDGHLPRVQGHGRRGQRDRAHRGAQQGAGLGHPPSRTTPGSAATGGRPSPSPSGRSRYAGAPRRSRSHRLA